MTKQSKRRRRDHPSEGRPSLFFIIVLALGLLFLAMLFVRGISRSAPPGVPGTPPAQR